MGRMLAAAAPDATRGHIWAFVLSLWRLHCLWIAVPSLAKVVKQGSHVFIRDKASQKDNKQDCCNA